MAEISLNDLVDGLIAATERGRLKWRESEVDPNSFRVTVSTGAVKISRETDTGSEPAYTISVVDQGMRISLLETLDPKTGERLFELARRSYLRRANDVINTMILELKQHAG
jgi:hypothetical protein